jgi:phosphate transport system permease protein
MREALIKMVLFGCAIFSIITTISIIVVLTTETISFFRTNTSNIVATADEAEVASELDPDSTPEYLRNWRIVEPGEEEGQHGGHEIASGDFVSVPVDGDRTLLLPAGKLLAATGRPERLSSDQQAVLDAYREIADTPDGDRALSSMVAFTESGPRTKEVTPLEFLTETRWSPLLGEEKHFGIWPLITGTLLITLIAAIFALPIGLVTAIFLSEYAPSWLRSFLKPILEILAGIPTVVYGFFALTVLTPGLNWLGQFYNNLVNGTLIFDTYNAMAAGLAVGIMILPIVSSLAEDALRAVPRSLRDGAYALGSTRFDVSVRVVVPAALSGIMASFLLAITRAVGETMIVALAAGGLAQMAYDPTGPAQTMTAYMVQIFLGDAPATGVEYKSSYAIAAVLFIMTLILTVAGNMILRKFQEEYE